MEVLYMLLLVVIQVWLCCTATQVIIVFPDDPTNVSCPSQPCATLSQYLLANNGTLPVVSNVEYHFLSGEHHLHTIMTLEYLSNVSLVGVESDVSSSVTLITCSSNRYFQIAITHSQNVTIDKITLRHCKVATKLRYLLLHICISCKLENINFLEGGLATQNVYGNFIMKNVNFEHRHQILEAKNHIYFAIKIFYDDELWDRKYSVNTVEINYSSISGLGGIYISLDQMNYDVNIMINNSLFYNMTDKVISITGKIISPIMIENCIFISNQCAYIEPMIVVEIKKIYVTFLNCTFYQNNYWSYLILIKALPQTHSEIVNCSTVPDVIFQGCSFISNRSPIMAISGPISNSSCMLNLVIRGPSLVNSNYVPIQRSPIIIAFTVVIQLVGPIIVSKNYASEIIFCQYCSLVFTNDISFISNQCINLIMLQSEMAYIKLLAYANIIFSSNVYSNELVVLGSILSSDNPYIFCGFQYITLTNKTTTLTTDYNITFTNNRYYNNGIYPTVQCGYSFNSPCRWIPSSVFHGFNPAVINQQIIQTDQHQLNQHTFICYCSHNITNCSVDVLGAVYPGQMLQVDLCVPNGGQHSILYLETHNKFLPASACKIAHQAELLQTITSYSNTVNFTIVTEEKKTCEIFITASPCLYSKYEIF